MRVKNPSLSITIPLLLDQTEEYGVSIDEWCLQGCGQQCQEGSKYCSQKCFRDALLDQDVECVNKGLSRDRSSCNSPLSSATNSTARSASPYSPRLSNVSNFSRSNPIISPTISTFPNQPTSLSCALDLFSSTSATENLQSVYGCLKLTNKPNKRCPHHSS